MTGPKEDDGIEEKVLELAKNLLDYVSHAATGDAWTKIVAASITICIVLAVGAVFFKAVSKALEQLIKLFEAYKNSPFKIVLGNEKKGIIRRRKQFCAVLDADLAFIAKAESWNDQYFTDLEAEVEIEGGYYTSALDKLRKRRSHGLRRVASLMDAIEASTERAILLVGEPGSGKSVALRHLAKQLAEKGKRSNNAKAIIPLYLNLRELEARAGVAINSDLIRQFVLENIRRGDADTSAFVQDNWSKNKDEGTWLFLFDSFDEIPAVLHAASGSVAVREYSRAIREFLDGMGECRSILASREYKGPEALPWKKFRILPLSKDRQRQLVENSFLDGDKKHLVNQHLAVERSTLGNNPLFLTLLCRFVKDVGAQPTNDHQLLTSHLQRLSAREPEYILRKYNLSSEQLMEGAEKLAVLFASNPSLSLSPRLDEIFLAMGVAETNHEELQNLISALVDVKIGRNDVATARHGDRRFAFSHRRYQETLFANFLAANPGRIPANDLLLRPEWRDYAVTLLQTQTIATTKGMLQAATELLTKKAEVQVQVPAKYMSELGAGFFNWEGEAFVSVLTILQEGLARRLQDVPEELSTAVSKILCPRWDSGDHLDRYMVIKLGGLLPQAQLAKYLRSALSDSRPQISAIAFKQCVFLRETSEEITKLICEKLARETLAADKTVAKLRLEALAQRLPSSVGALFVFRRCLRLRSILAKLCILSWVLLLPNLIAAQLARRIPTAGLLRERSDRLHLTFVYRGGNDWVIGLLAPLVMSLIYEFMVVSKKAKKIDADIIGQVFIKFCESTYFFPMLATYIFAAVLLIAVYKLRSEGHPLSLSLLFSVKRFKSLAADVLPLIYSLAGLGVLALLPFILGNVVKYVAGFLGYQMVVDSVYFNIGMPSVLALIISGGMLLTIYELRENRARNKRLIRLKAEFDDDCYIFLQAQKLSEAAIWLVTHPTFLASKKEDVRSASSIIRRLTDLNGRAGAEKYPLILAPVDPFQYMIVSNSVAVRALALEEIA